MKLDDNTREEAARWFAALRRGPMALDERAAFDAWRADPRNQAGLNAMHELWGEVSGLKDLGVVAPRPARRLPAMAAAAAVLVAVVGGGLLYGQLADERIATRVGEQRVANLSDGSVVGLNVATRIAYDVGPDRRDVRLDEGEAVFFVRKDAARPFVVKAGDYEIRAVGTAFNVRQRDDCLDVSVMDGVVAVTRGGVAIARLPAGRRLTLDVGKAPVSTAAPIQSMAEWRLRIVHYEDADVASVVADLNRFFERPIVVDDPELARRRVTLRLQVEDRERTLRTLGELIGADIERRRAADALKPENVSPQVG